MRGREEEETKGKRAVQVMPELEPEFGLTCVGEFESGGGGGQEREREKTKKGNP